MTDEQDQGPAIGTGDVPTLRQPRILPESVKKLFAELRPRDPARIERMLEKLRHVWARYPDMRLGQIISNVSPLNADLFMVEDDVVEKGLDEFGA